MTSSIESAELREYLRHELAEALEPIAQFWPMKTFIHHNPIHGLERLPFHQAIREANHLLGGRGYLPQDEYRQYYRDGRITESGIMDALRQLSPPTGDDTVRIGDRDIQATHVRFLHLVYGFDPVEPALLPWMLHQEQATRRFRRDLPLDARQRLIDRTIEECELCRNYPERAYVTNLWKSTLATMNLPDPATPHGSTPVSHRENANHPHATGTDEIALPFQRTLSDWVDQLAATSLGHDINSIMIKWSAAFVDEGLAAWAMPDRAQGFYGTWKALAVDDLSGPLMEIAGYAEKVEHLPDAPEDALIQLLHRLDIPHERWRDYLSRHLAQLSGWAGFIRWRGEHPHYAPQQAHPIDPLQYLAVRLFYEVELTAVACAREWNVAGTASAVRDYWRQQPEAYHLAMHASDSTTDAATHRLCRDAWRIWQLAQFLELPPIDVQELPSATIATMLHWLDTFPSEQHNPIWLEAYEDAYRRRISRQLSDHRGTVPPLDTRPLAQMVFCIDVRSESFRRHVEATGPYETLGFAGFFGIPLSHQAFDTEERVALCPVLLSPNHEVTEVPRSDESCAMAQYASGSRWEYLAQRLFRQLTDNPISSFMLVDSLGVFFSLSLLGKTLIVRTYDGVLASFRRWFVSPVSTRVAVGPTPEAKSAASPMASGFTDDEQTAFVENGLRAMGLTANFGRFVVLCGHGSTTENNPYFGALDCGACGGNHGDPNARVFAAMGNNPAVRTALRERGLPIPDDTFFVAAKHNTTTDNVVFYDVADIPDSHQKDYRALVADLREAGSRQALERCHRLPRAPTSIAPAAAFSHVASRSADWANTRPEWGLASNAAFLIGRRALTRGLDLRGRVFLHSYDPAPDTEGSILEKIMTAPLIVGEWINMEHYFSSVDPWAYGSGSKVIHNVVSGIGVMLGSQSDLQTGLPLQTVNNGVHHHHEPMRLLTIIEAPPERITPIIGKHEILQQLFHNQWVNLLAWAPDTWTFSRYHANGEWTPLQHRSVHVCG